jgi:recombination associated protein RdgC
MWFKNAIVYTFTQPFSLPDDFEAQLESYAFKPTERHQLASYGFISPFGNQGKVLHHRVGDNVLLVAKREEKDLPPAAINGMLDEQAEAYEQEHARPLPRKERAAIKEDIIHQMLPTAFSINKLTYAYIDLKGQRLVVVSTSRSKAEEFNALLRGALGSLPVKPWNADVAASDHFTHWVREAGNLPSPFSLGDEVKLQGIGDDPSVTVHRKQDLTSDEIASSLDHGKVCIKLALVWEDHMSFSLTDDFSIKSIKYSDVLKEQTADSADDKASQLDADFALVSGELNQLLAELEEHCNTQSRAA